MQDHIGIIPITTCLFSSTDPDRDPTATATASVRPGQTAVSSTYRANIAGLPRLVTVTWRRGVLLRGLTVSIDGSDRAPGPDEPGPRCKVELKPWSFWRRQGSRRLVEEVAVWWDLRAARFGRAETGPGSGYYVAVVAGDEAVLLLGDMRDKAYKRTGSRPSLADPILVSKREHVFGNKRDNKFSARAKFHEKGKLHEIAVQYCKNTSNGNNNNNAEVSCGASNHAVEPEMEIRLDGQVLVHVKNLQWKFRGNESVRVGESRLEVFWDVHDWLFSPGLRRALFIFKPVNYRSMSSASANSSLSSSSSSSSSSGSFEGLVSGGSSEFCFFLYAWLEG